MSSLLHAAQHQERQTFNYPCRSAAYRRRRREDECHTDLLPIEGVEGNEEKTGRCIHRLYGSSNSSCNSIALVTVEAATAAAEASATAAVAVAATAETAAVAQQNSAAAVAVA